MYNTNKALQTERKDVAFLSAGIHENVALLNVRSEKSQNGNNFIEFKFTKDGSTLSHTEYEPKKFGTMTDAELTEKADKQAARILQIMGAFFTKEQLSNFEANTFTEFGEWVTRLMAVADKSKLVRLKAVYNNSFVGLPKYNKYTFIEPMTIERDKSMIRELTIDTFIKPESGDVEEQSTSAASTFASQSTNLSNTSNTSDLPF